MLKRRQIRAIKRAFRKLFKQGRNLSLTVYKNIVHWLVRNLLLIANYRKRHRTANPSAGFVLPTIVMLLLVVTLVVATLLMRTQSRTTQVIGAREEQVIYNAATPAIERAKAKLEFLFTQDTRIPSASPSDQLLLKMLVNNDTRYPGLTTNVTPDPYTFGNPGQVGAETRIDLNGDGNPNNDPAWGYQADIDNDGKNETIVYGIYLRSRSDDNATSISGVIGTDPNGNPIIDANGRADTDREKARALVTRNGPISTINLNDPVCGGLTAGSTPPPPETISNVDESVWYPAGSGVLRKTFQVDAIVVSSKDGTSRTVATLEFQQDRQLDRANRWGAWFRYDLEVFPGASFNWNGAMYSAGNFFVGSSGQFRTFLISAPKSCFYGKDSSEITVLEEPTRPGETPKYQGQFIANSVHTGSGGSANIDLQLAGGNNTNPDRSPNNVVPESLQSNNDSSTKAANQAALNPVVLFTRDESRATGGNEFNRDAREQNWNGRNFVQRGRFRNQLQNPPYVDDTYRADNRYGPKPKYDRVDQDLWLDTASRKNGQPIPNTPGDPKIRKLINNTSNPVSDPEFRELGLDGYWERRAWANGLRVIVSPRLELGNALGWVNSSLNPPDPGRTDPGEIDPLYPANPDPRSPAPISHEQQQRRTLRDNLASVQATVLYHQDSGLGGDFPIACLATTTHPGTQQAELNSRNFRSAGQNYWYPGQPAPSPLISDFFYGTGTNGWEYTVPSQAEFSGGPLRTALQNLANFAGDYENPNNSGAFPPSQSIRVYPNPYLTMWGNFSNLKRALALPASNSIADNSYIHTAGCVVGMLANNINYFLAPPTNYTLAWWGGGPANFTSLADALELAPALQPQPGLTSPWPAGYTPKPDDYIAALPAGNQKALAKFVHMKEQIIRDRRYGFADTPTTGSFTYTITKQVDDAGTSTPFEYAGRTYSNTDTVTLGCDPTSPTNNYFGLGNPTGWTADQEKRFVILATSLCSAKPKFPSLYYIFPEANHDRLSPPVGATLPAGEPYLSPPSPSNNSYPNDSFTFVDPATITMVQPKGENWTGGNNGARGNWYLPTTDNLAQTDVDFGIVTPSAGNDNFNRYVSLIDSAFLDSREKMTVRALNMDLNLLRRNTLANNNTWLPRSGIVYAFREDAVREDAIARPGSGTNPNNNTNPNSPTDPLLETNGLSRKPVDFYADPDRRPYGFRLRNGQDLRRFPNGSVDVDNPRGITLVSDNPVYIQGNFNFHSTDGNNNDLEEFNTPLDGNWGNFYTRDNSGLNPRFARIRDAGRSPADTWRPAEILSDAITILSNNFAEGFIDGGITNDPAAVPGGRYSFRAMNRPNNNNPGNGWLLEDGKVRTPAAADREKPIKVSHNGNPFFCNAAPVNGYCPPANVVEYTQGNGYQTFVTDYRGDINQASPTRVNAIIVSGIIPTRTGQQNGGFHNFPRYIENWNGVDSTISGSFVQLNFSTYATAPYNQVAWEPGSGPSGNNIQYYQPPNRIWGYDVGLQYAPAGPMSQRFVTTGRKRSEFYRDLRVDDPYICRLRLALNTSSFRSESGQQLDPASLRECL
jgi:hypothetical protein